MLTLSLGQPITSNYVIDFEGLFEQYVEKSWFQNKKIQDVIKEVDNTEYIGDLAFRSPVLGIIGPDDLSGGVKCLISSCFIKELYPIDWLGNNCKHALAELSKDFDLTYTLNYSMFEFEDDQEIYVAEFNDIIIGKDIYGEIFKRGYYNEIAKGLQICLR